MYFKLTGMRNADALEAPISDTSQQKIGVFIEAFYPCIYKYNISSLKAKYLFVLKIFRFDYICHPLRF